MVNDSSKESDNFLGVKSETNPFMVKSRMDTASQDSFGRDE